MPKYDLNAYFFENKNDSSFQSERSCNQAAMADLICSARERSSIKSIMSGKRVAINKLNVDNFLSLANSSKILHTATHSCVDENNVSDSKIYMNKSYLTVSQIRNAQINSELTILSSCESGFGNIFNGEGALSIAKAFFQAGSKSALVSLWPVDDCSTSDIMKYFYHNLVQGKDKAASLAAAKKEYLANAHPSRSHPYYWAGFVLIGDAEPIFHNPSSPNPFIILIGIISLILLFLFYYFRK